jgi:hypothetical protein
MPTPNYENPWRNAKDFVDLGAHELDGAQYDLFCFTSAHEKTHIGARCGDTDEYLTATIDRSYRAGVPRMVCFGHTGPFKEAVARMGARGLFTEPVLDLADRVIFDPAAHQQRYLHELYALWDKLGDIPVTEEGLLDEAFEQFPRGTDREEIWHWFEAQNPDFIVGEVLQGKRHNP